MERKIFLGNMERRNFRTKRKEVFTIKNFFAKYGFELVVFIIGVIITFISNFIPGITNPRDVQVIIIIITLSIDVMSLKIVSFKEQLLKEINESLAVIEMINDKNRIYSGWSYYSNKLFLRISRELKTMAEGKLELQKKELIRHQAKMMKNAKERVYAIHLATTVTAIERWDKEKTTKDFSQILINANKEIIDGIEKKRLFVLDKNLLSDEKTEKMWERILVNQKEELKFDVKVITIQEIKKDDRIDMPLDTLLCDKEIVVVHFIDKVAKAEIYYDSDEVERGCEAFDELWQIAKKTD